MQVPFHDIKAQDSSILQEIDDVVHQVIDNTAFASGPFVADFERNFAGYCGCTNGIGVGSGTEALWLSLLALGVGPGDMVITVPNSFIATAEAISYCGATPLFVDIDERTYNMDPQKLSDLLKIKNRDGRNRKKIKGIIPVHLFGQTADMYPIMEIAENQELFILEDASQAHGATYKGRPAGSMGRAGCFSFYPGKNLGAYGEAGAVVTNDDSLAEKIKMMRDHGQSKKYFHDFIGWNSRMDGIQGAILNVKLKYLEKQNEKRRDNAALYDLLLRNLERIIPPFKADYSRHVYHIYAVRMDKRDRVAEALTKKNIQWGIHYPVPIHLTEAYRQLGYSMNSFPSAEKCAQQILSLPMSPELRKEQIEFVCNELFTIFSENTDVLNVA